MFKALKSHIPEHLRSDLRCHRSALRLGCKVISGKIARLFCRPPFPKNLDGSVNLHLGCGAVIHPLFINIDAMPAPHIHYVRRIDNLDPFSDNSVDLVYACHCLEHLPFAQIPRVLKEWHRVLKPGGILRVSVPDFDLLLDIYRENDKKVATIIGPLVGGQHNKFNYHKAIFNNSFLTELLMQSGFCSVREWKPGSSELTTFDDWSNRKIDVNGKEYRVSLNLEAIK